MNLQQLQTFVRVAELGSFSKAALVLGIAQPALSRQVRQLEVGLRATLLLRTGRGVALTEAGRRLFEHAVGILQLVARAEEAVSASRGEPAGRIVVGIPPSIARQLSVALVEAFEQHFPQARLAIVEGLSAHVAEWIATGRVDLGLLHNPEPQPALETEPVHAEELHLVSAPGAPAGEVRLEDLARYPLVIPERSHAIRRLLEARAAAAGVRLDIAWEISSVPAILELVRSGHGHAVLGPSAVSGPAGEGLRVRQIGTPPIVNTLFLAAAAARPATPLQQQFRLVVRQLISATFTR
jgi:LysR family nitrogen assimilation transcriptional regulator